MWDLIVSVPDHCLSFYFTLFRQRTRLLVVGPEPFLHRYCTRKYVLFL